MAKKKTTSKGQLGDWLDEVPEEVQDAANAYDKAHTAKSKAQAKLNTAKDVLIDKMREHTVDKVRIRNGEKSLVISATDRISYEKPNDDERA